MGAGLLVACARDSNLRYLLIGLGSNALFSSLKDALRGTPAAVLTKEARRAAAQAWDSRMDKTISNPETGRRASWRRVVLLEAQKLQRHILDGAGYEPFRYRW